MKKQSYYYQTIDKTLIVLLALWSVYTLFGHTLIHATQDVHSSPEVHIHNDGSHHMH